MNGGFGANGNVRQMNGGLGVTGNARQWNGVLDVTGNARRWDGGLGAIGSERHFVKKDRSLIVGYNRLTKMESDEPSSILLTLSHPDTEFSTALQTCKKKDDLLIMMISVLARAFTCDTLQRDLDIVLQIMIDQGFFDTAAKYFMKMSYERRAYVQDTLKKPIKDMIALVSEVNSQSPASIIQTIGVHSILQCVIDGLQVNSTIIDHDILTSFKKLTEQKEKLLNKTKRRQEDADDGEDDDDEFPRDFRDIAIFPQTADMKVRNDPYLRANKVKGRYENIDYYLDVQYRLLREDLIGQLRDGIDEYVQHIEDGKPKKVHSMRLYQSVRLVCPISRGSTGLCHVLHFDVTRLRYVDWRSTKRLMYGALLCLSSDNFATFYFATVESRDPKDLEQGLISVQFQHSQTEIKELFGKSFIMTESLAYFEAYRYVLCGLKNFHQGDLPFERYLISCDKEVGPPAYLTRSSNPVFDVGPLLDENINSLDSCGSTDSCESLYCLDSPNYDDIIDLRGLGSEFRERFQPTVDVEILNRQSWPPADRFNLDESQFRAIHTALTKEFSVIQGPPGTGKTHIGLKIVNALLHNKKVWSTHPDTGEQDLRPMLIVCYTNHALDQFLEGIVEFYKGDVLRVGSRSNSQVLKEKTLTNVRARVREERGTPVEVFKAKQNVQTELYELSTTIERLSLPIQLAYTNILHENYLQSSMNTHYHLLMNQFHDWLAKQPRSGYIYNNPTRISVIVEWLELGNLAPEIELENVPPSVNDRMDREDYVDEEVDFIQKQRQLHIDDDEQTQKVDKAIIESEIQKVAMRVKEMDEKPDNMEEHEWQRQKKRRINTKILVQKNLCDGDIMSEEEADRIQNMIRMPLRDKWRLYRLWRKRYCEYYLQKINEVQEEYNATATRFKEIQMQSYHEELYSHWYDNNRGSKVSGHIAGTGTQDYCC